MKALLLLIAMTSSVAVFAERFSIDHDGVEYWIISDSGQKWPLPLKFVVEGARVEVETLGSPSNFFVKNISEDKSEIYVIPKHDPSKGRELGTFGPAPNALVTPYYRGYVLPSGHEAIVLGALDNQIHHVSTLPHEPKTQVAIKVDGEPFKRLPTEQFKDFWVKLEELIQARQSGQSITGMLFAQPAEGRRVLFQVKKGNVDLMFSGADAAILARAIYEDCNGSLSF